MKPVNLPRHSSFAAAVLIWVLLDLLAVFIIWEFRDRARLIRDNDNERILNTLFTGSRDYNDFGSAIAASDVLRGRITGFAIYAADLSLLERWGKAPEKFDPALLEGEPLRRFNRYTIPDRLGQSVKFVIHNENAPPSRQQPPGRETGENRRPPGEGQGSQRNPPRQWGPFFNALTGGNYLYIDISHSAYWHTIILTNFLYPVCFIVLLALVFAVRYLYLRNIEYRQRIEAQQNLVVLGTAASTLAHEIRNPLYSIKLQTGILKKISEGQISEGKPALASCMEEITRIEEEADRLAALTYRVNDYLRDAGGNPETFLVDETLEEISRRLCGCSILTKDSRRSCPIRMDRERARSVFENIIRNSLEAGSPVEGITARIAADKKDWVITIEDRGKGIPQDDLGRLFDPFYTSKSTGTGIGLAISKRFIDAAGGSIVLENRTGSSPDFSAGGIIAKITLPAVPDREQG